MIEVSISEIVLFAWASPDIWNDPVYIKKENK